MRKRHFLWFIPLLLMLVLGAGAGFLVSTQTGLLWVVALADRFAPGDIEYDRLEGRLIGPLALENLRYRDEETAVRIGQAEFDWAPAALLSATARIHRLTAHDIEIHLPEAAPPEEPVEPFALPDIRLPLRINVRDVDITEVHIYPAGTDQPVVIDQILLRARTEVDTVVLETFHIRTPEGELHAQGQLEPVDDYPLDFKLDWDFQIPEFGPLAGTGTLTGNLERELQVTHRLSGAVVAELDARLRELLTTPSWSGRLTLTTLDLGRLDPALAGSNLAGELQTQGTPDDFAASGHLATTLPEVGPVETAFQGTGSTEIIRISEWSLRTAERPLQISAQATLDLTELHLDATGQWQALAWPLNEQPQIESPSGTFAFQGTPQDYHAQLEAILSSAEFGELHARLRAAGTEQDLEVSELILHSPDEQLALTAQGRLSFAELSFEASGEWRSLVWPLVGEPQVESPRGSFQAQGSIQDYRFTLDTQLQGPAIPPGSWRLEGRGSAEAMERATLRGEVLEGEVEAQLSARWQPEVNWQAELSARDINPGAQWEQLPGRLALQARSQGSLIEERLQTTLNLEDLSGTLNEQSVQGRGQLAVDGEALAVDALQITVGNARLDASGTLDRRWDFNWQLEAPNLALLLPDAAGRLSGTGRISGPREQPQAQLTLSGDGLAYLDNRIERLRTEAQLDLSGESRSQLTLTATDLELAGQAWQQLTVEGAGLPAAHNLQASLRGPPGRFDLALEGGLEAEIWEGRLSRLSAQGDAFGSWQLESPAAVRAAAEQAALQQTCLVSIPARLCVQGEWDQQRGASGQLTLERLQLARFQELLPPGVELNTSLNGEAAGSWRPDGTLQAEAELALSPGELRLITTSPPLEVTLREGILQAEATEAEATVQLGIDLGPTGRIAANVRVENLQDAPRPLAGEVAAQIEDLSPVQILVPQLENVSGRLVADLDLGGTVATPHVGGEVRLEDAATDVPPAGIRVEDIQLTAASTDMGPLQISGSARSGPGQLRLSGQWQLAQGQLELNVQGENFEALDTLELQALISPDLNLNLEQDRLNISGRITVPQAFLSPPELEEGGVPISEDVVIVSDPDEIEPPRILRIFTRIRIILGDEVRVEAAGFRGNIRGNVVVEQTPQLPPRGTGTVEVEAGEYRVYGQDLEVRRGRILYVGSPLDNPGLDLEVVRRVADVTAGVRVRGTLRVPEFELFSTPSMPDTSILSYIAFGRPPDVRSAEEGELLLRAAAALGLGGGNLVVQRLRDAFGLDYLRFESPDNELVDVALVIGKYLTPNLYVSYGVGLFEAANTFSVRYEITEWLIFESTSNGHTGADLIYSIER